MRCSPSPLASFGTAGRALRNPFRNQQRVDRAPQPIKTLQVASFWQGSSPPTPQGKGYFSKMAQRFQKARRSPAGETSVSKVYADANTKEPKEYWEYETLTVSWGCVTPRQWCADRQCKQGCT